MSTLFKNYYTAASKTHWTGRTDGTERAHLRWHQVVECIDLNEAPSLTDSVVLLGYTCDEGVKRNLGRPGAAKGPAAIRKACAHIPLPLEQTRRIIDAGDIQCKDNNLEASQEALGHAVACIIEKGGFPIVLGGGHEVTFGHYLGLRNAYNKRIGIINFDAHFDIREPMAGVATSGTGFYQIAQRNEEFSYLAIGIQQISNTQVLFDTATNYGVKWITAQDFDHTNAEAIEQELHSFIDTVDHIYITVDMDVFAAAYAPGVSAPAYNGVTPNRFFLQVFEQIIRSPKLVSIDFAELNPDYDIDNRTAKLVADLVFRVVKP